MAASIKKSLAPKRRVFRRTETASERKTHDGKKKKVSKISEKSEEKKIAQAATDEKKVATEETHEFPTEHAIEHVSSVQTEDMAVEVGTVEESKSQLVEPHQASTLPPSSEEESEVSRKNRFFIISVSVLVIVLILGIVFTLFFKKTTQQTENTPSSDKVIITLQPLPTNTPTPVDVSKLTIKILNGSGISGEASRLKALLTTAGFTVSSIGNAESSDYEKTIVQVKPGVDEAQVRVLKEKLAETYVLGGDDTLEKNDIYDVIVIIGQETASQ